MSELVDQIAKLEAKANQLKDSVSAKRLSSQHRNPMQTDLGEPKIRELHVAHCHIFQLMLE